jgi:hypothetical protein
VNNCGIRLVEKKGRIDQEMKNRAKTTPILFTFSLKVITLTRKTIIKIGISSIRDFNQLLFMSATKSM